MTQKFVHSEGISLCVIDKYLFFQLAECAQSNYGQRFVIVLPSQFYDVIVTAVNSDVDVSFSSNTIARSTVKVTRLSSYVFNTQRNAFSVRILKNLFCILIKILKISSFQLDKTIAPI